jgi:hypothetical protein
MMNRFSRAQFVICWTKGDVRESRVLHESSVIGRWKRFIETSDLNSRHSFTLETMQNFCHGPISDGGHLGSTDESD